MHLLNPASLPELPSFPNRLVFAGGGLGAGMVIGLGLARVVGVARQVDPHRSRRRSQLADAGLGVITVWGDRGPAEQRQR